MTKEFLDEIVPDRPVALMSGDVHSMWLNTAGLRHVGVDPANESGVLLEMAAFTALGVLNAVPEVELDVAVQSAAQMASYVPLSATRDPSWMTSADFGTSQVARRHQYRRV